MATNLPNNDDYKKIKEMLNEYHSTDNSQRKEELKSFIVMQMIPVVKKIAKTIARRATDPIEDLIQAGFIGLLKAIDNYNEQKNDNFRVYAGYLIIGEMKHFLRDKLNTIRVPRHIQELSVRIYNFTKTLTYEELQNLTSDEVATALDVPTHSVDFAMQMERRKDTVSLDEIFKNDGGNLGYEEILADQNYEEKSEYEDAKMIYNDVIGKLPPEQRVILDMYYNQDMNQKEIAEAMMMSQMALSRRMKSALNNIQTLINNKKDEGYKKVIE